MTANDPPVRTQTGLILRESLRRWPLVRKESPPHGKWTRPYAETEPDLSVHGTHLARVKDQDWATFPRLNIRTPGGRTFFKMTTEERSYSCK